jgi:integrase
MDDGRDHRWPPALQEHPHIEQMPRREVALTLGTEVFEGRFQLIKTNAPTFEQWGDQFLPMIRHLKTRSRYSSSINNMKPRFGKLRLSQITPDLIDDFKDDRLAKGTGPATVNRDLAVLRRMLRIAEWKRFIARTPFTEVEFLEERSIRRKPHIVTFEEEERILEVANPHIRVLTVLLLETRLRSNREALVLKWEDIDFVSDTIRIKESKTPSGLRNVPLSGRCKTELLALRNRLGPNTPRMYSPTCETPSDTFRRSGRAGQRVGVGWNSIFLDLQPATHICPQTECCWCLRSFCGANDRPLKSQHRPNVCESH